MRSAQSSGAGLGLAAAEDPWAAGAEKFDEPAGFGVGGPARHTAASRLALCPRALAGWAGIGVRSAGVGMGAGPGSECCPAPWGAVGSQGVVWTDDDDGGWLGRPIG